jgi:hypothetical protein
MPSTRAQTINNPLECLRERKVSLKNAADLRACLSRATKRQVCGKAHKLSRHKAEHFPSSALNLFKASEPTNEVNEKSLAKVC